MTKEANQPQAQPMDPELFKRPDDGLRKIFEENIKHTGRHATWDQTHDIAAAQAAQALIDLHTRCKPE